MSPWKEGLQQETRTKRYLFVYTSNNVTASERVGMYRHMDSCVVKLCLQSFRGEQRLDTPHRGVPKVTRTRAAEDENELHLNHTLPMWPRLSGRSAHTSEHGSTDGSSPP
ncbi:hypothetical protein F2P81_001729 [Scophthalmus maximus]|uniref:Uncharacterized protein n=1 Tax=Scophthalmus maximus TaxID=52904 RepID=A0A6A4TNT2_SCOMX|nr:hypothetical protein F2P81_001729 [Scophthalmus maximus]